VLAFLRKHKPCLIPEKGGSLCLAELVRSWREANADGSSESILGAMAKTRKRKYHNRTAHGSLRPA
jgi:hypothetical protein